MFLLMLTIVNPQTGNQFKVSDNTELNELVTDPDDGTMLEVVSINSDAQTAQTELVEVEEDWGQ